MCKFALRNLNEYELHTIYKEEDEFAEFLYTPSQHSYSGFTINRIGNGEVITSTRDNGSGKLILEFKEIEN